MKCYVAHRSEIDRAFKKGYTKGISKGANSSLNQFLNICMQTLDEDYNWDEDEIIKFRDNVINRVKELNEIILRDNNSTLSEQTSVTANGHVQTIVGDEE